MLADASQPVTLDAASIEAVARRVVELLRGEPGALREPKLVDATELAVRLGVSRDFVYANAEKLGARRLGTGRKPRLRFDVEEAQAAVSCFTVRTSQEGAGRMVEPKRLRRRPAVAGSGAPLLPIRGRPTISRPPSTTPSAGDGDDVSAVTAA